MVQITKLEALFTVHRSFSRDGLIGSYSNQSDIVSTGWKTTTHLHIPAFSPAAKQKKILGEGF